MSRLTVSIFIIVLLGCTTVISAIQVRELQWEDLLGTFEFEDPFEKLTSEQIVDLSTYIRLRKLKESDPARVTQNMDVEGREAESRLKAEGINVDYLLSVASEIKAKYEKKTAAVVPKLHGQRVKLPGYLLPLEFDEKKITEFLLVPWFGACIHTPPPPPNQIVFVTMEEGYGSEQQFEPVWVWGEMQVKSVQANLFLVDGNAGIDTGYTLIAEKITPYSPTNDN